MKNKIYVISIFLLLIVASLIIPVNAAPRDMEVTLEADTTSVKIGETITFTVTIENTGEYLNLKNIEAILDFPDEIFDDANATNSWPGPLVIGDSIIWSGINATADHEGTGNCVVAVDALDTCDNPIQKTDSIEITCEPVENPCCCFTFNVDGMTVSFDASCTIDPDGDAIVSYDWDFSDGETDTGLTVTHIYDDPGLYNVCLTVTDDDDSSSSCCQDVEIEDVTPPWFDDPCQRCPGGDADGFYRPNEKITFQGWVKDDSGFPDTHDWGKFVVSDPDNIETVYEAPDVNYGTPPIWIELSFNKKGGYTYHWEATDAAGNIGESICCEFFIFNQPPTDLKLTSTKKEGKTDAYLASARDLNGDIIYFKFHWADGSETDWIEGNRATEQNNWKVSITIEHEHESGVKFKAKDNWGEESDWSEPTPTGKNKNIKIQSTFLAKILNKLPLIEKILNLPIFKILFK